MFAHHKCSAIADTCSQPQVSDSIELCAGEDSHTCMAYQILNCVSRTCRFNAQAYSFQSHQRRLWAASIIWTKSGDSLHIILENVTSIPSMMSSIPSKSALETSINIKMQRTCIGAVLQDFDDWGELEERSRSKAAKSFMMVSVVIRGSQQLCPVHKMPNRVGLAVNLLQLWVKEALLSLAKNEIPHDIEN